MDKIQALKVIIESRNYFGENDKTAQEHKLYDCLDEVHKFLKQEDKATKYAAELEEAKKLAEDRAQLLTTAFNNINILTGIIDGIIPTADGLKIFLEANDINQKKIAAALNPQP